MKYQDIQIPDLTLQQQFVQKWLDEDYTGALAMLSNSTLSSKKFVSTIFSTLAQTLSALEQHYFTEFPDALEIKLEQYHNAINHFIYKGNWDSSISYEIGNYILYNEFVYACIKNNTNRMPTNTEYWAYLGLKGEKGAYGIESNMRYLWNNIPTYNPKDIVYHNEFLWYCTETNTNIEPTESATQWEKFLYVPSARIVISESEPINPKDGLVWMKVDSGEAVNVVKVATGQIEPTSTTESVSYTGNLLGTFSKDASGELVLVNTQVIGNSVAFTSAQEPNTVITCSVAYM